MDSQPDLEIQLLGTFRLTYRGQLVRNVLTKRLAALLAYLLIHRQELISRQRLAFLFWPDSSDSQARTNLRRLLHQLREAFPAINDYLYTEATDLSWNLAVPYRLDIAEFERAADQASDIPELQKAIDLYQGDLVPDLYEDWVQDERERLGGVYEDLLVRLAHFEEEKGFYPNAIRAGQRLLQHDPLREETYRLLMRLHSKMGDRTGIRRVYNTCKAVLRRELEVGPDPETEVAYQTWFQAVSSLLSKSGQITPSLHQKKADFPVFLETLIGRDEDLEQVRALVISNRLVTLTGFGGVGKTRLGLAAAADLHVEYPNGRYWIDLARLENPALIPQVFADVLGVYVDSRSLLVDRLIEFMANKRMLLVVDNCEHLIEVAGHLIEQVLKACQGLHILATSRISLRIPGETIYQVQPLPVPTPASKTIDEPKRWIESLQQNSSVMLFMDRARSILPTFALHEENQEAVVQICLRLEGIPLALELAAGRIRLLDPKGIAERLDRVFCLLGGGKNSLPRHQTLQATLDWSYALLLEQEKSLFRRLSVFAGGWTLEAAESVCSGEGIKLEDVLDLMAQLVDKSLVVVVNDGSETRYRSLDIIRQYAREKLDSSGLTSSLCQKHAVYYANLQSKTDYETDNIRAVFHWCLETGEAEPVLQLSRDFFFWEKRVSEGLQLISQVLAMKGAPGQTSMRGHVLYSAAVLSYFHRDFSAGRVYVNELFKLSHEIKDEGLIWLQKFVDGGGALAEGDYERAYSVFLDARNSREGLDDEEKKFQYAVCTLGLASCALMLRKFDESRQYAEESRAIFFANGRNKYLVDSDMILGHVALEISDLKMANYYFRRGIRSAVESSVQQKLGAIFAGLGGVSLKEGKFHDAAQWFGVADMMFTVTGYHARVLPEAISDLNLNQLKLLFEPDAFQAAWSEGRSMKLEQAIASALDEKHE